MLPFGLGNLQGIWESGRGVLYSQDYADGLEYRTNGSGGSLTLEAIYHAEGRITPLSAGAYRYEYTIKDHLGNARLSFADLNGNKIVDVPEEIVQENHYYPFGMNTNYSWMNNTTLLDNRYQYNGKELNDDFGLNWNDYGARWYDAAVGRWWSVDPMAEKYVRWSGYNYAVDNPILFIDPDGMDIVLGIKKKSDESNDTFNNRRNAYLEKVQTLTNDILAFSGDKIVISKMGDGDKDGGTQLIRNLVDGVQLEDGTIKNFTVKIVDGESNGTNPVDENGDSNEEDASNGVGTGTEVTFNISGTGQNVVNANGTRGYRTLKNQVGLAHELIHANSNMRGTNDRTETNSLAPESSDGTKLTREELNTRKMDNIIRKEQSVMPRKINKE